MQSNSRWTVALANQYSLSTMKKIPYVMIIVLLISIVFIVVGRASWGGSLIGLDFFMFADYLSVKLAQKNINFVFSILLGALVSFVIFVLVTLSFGLLFRW